MMAEDIISETHMTKAFFFLLWEWYCELVIRLFKTLIVRDLRLMGTIESSHVKLLKQLAKGFVELSGFLVVASSLICNYSA
ncbi:hypothetical protein H6G33_12920 [Calothrix sp. FACHB-1219]|uniref:hypothetical protein n=1 Tax=unclassified Calothrix TaxID=2619626 RepID=UPI0016878060|nr:MULTISPECIES: hypothetical protein [unclassified Calothrix]MBD2202474.1 hypothetical protein [Calothrix sp. FACHB-168]MBD2217935.1 hypothetical protein [Calothrix sp. FACHB-1219]